MFHLSDTPLKQVARACFPKAQHLTQGKADAHIRALIRLEKDQKKTGDLRSYRCVHCGLWHVGHTGILRRDS